MNMDKQVNRDTQDRASHNTPPHGLLLSIHSLGASMSEKQGGSRPGGRQALGPSGPLPAPRKACLPQVGGEAALREGTTSGSH